MVVSLITSCLACWSWELGLAYGVVGRVPRILLRCNTTGNRFLRLGKGRRKTRFDGKTKRGNRGWEMPRDHPGIITRGAGSCRTILPSHVRRLGPLLSSPNATSSWADLVGLGPKLFRTPYRYPATWLSFQWQCSQHRLPSNSIEDS